MLSESHKNEKFTYIVSEGNTYSKPLQWLIKILLLSLAITLTIVVAGGL